MKFLISLSYFFYLVSSTLGAPQVLNGAGATFPYPLYSKWFSEFRNMNSQVQINYQSIGSGGGIRQLLDKTIDFGASDIPMTDEQLSKASEPIVHIPTVLGAVVITYSLAEKNKPLRLTPELISDVFLGKITKWDDSKIKKLNPWIESIPNKNIIVVHRSDGSGTTGVFSDYLSKVSPEWKQKVGSGPALKWPVGLGGKGNEGVSGLVKQTPGSIGYVELTYAETNNLAVAEVLNAAGEFIKPSAKTVTAAAEGVLKTIPEDFRTSITNAPGKNAYPISSFTYLLIYKKMGHEKTKPIIKFLNWALEDGQKYATTLSYAPLPKSLVLRIKKKIKELN